MIITIIVLAILAAVSITSLTGDLVINANPTSYERCLISVAINSGCSLKLSGSSTMLNEILATATIYNSTTTTYEPNSNVSLK